MTATIVVLALVAAALILYYLLRKKGEPSGWSAGPIIDGHNYSAATAMEPTGSFDFPRVDGVHYVTKATGSLTDKTQITFRYRIDADPGVQFVSAKTATPITMGPVLYFERANDDWSGIGQYETYRWWASFAIPPMTVGEHEVTARFDQKWTAIETSDSLTSAAAFQAALANAARIGFTFLGDGGYGHGLYATGTARFTLLEFTVA